MEGCCSSLHLCGVAVQCKMAGVGARMQRCNAHRAVELALIGGRGDRNQKAESRRQKAEVPVIVGDNGMRRVAKHVNSDVFWWSVLRSIYEAHTIWRLAFCLAMKG